MKVNEFRLLTQYSIWWCLLYFSFYSTFISVRFFPTLYMTYCNALSVEKIISRVIISYLQRDLTEICHAPYLSGTKLLDNKENKKKKQVICGYFCVFFSACLPASLLCICMYEIDRCGNYFSRTWTGTTCIGPLLDHGLKGWTPKPKKGLPLIFAFLSVCMYCFGSKKTDIARSVLSKFIKILYTAK